MAVAPKPISKAQSRPRRAPSLIMVRLTGPTGTERTKPKKRPVNAADSEGGRSNISGGETAAVLLFLLLDFVADLAGNPGPDKAVEQIEGEDQGQDDRQDQAAQNKQAAGEDEDEDCFGERAARPQIQRLERGVLDLAYHHEGEKQEQSRQQVAPRAGGKVGVILVPHQKQGQRRHQSGGRRDGESEKLLASAPA